MNRLQFRIILTLLVLPMLMGNTECDCEGSGDSGSSSGTPVIPTYSFHVQNNYGVTIGYEVWEGTDLDYSEGTVLGNSLNKTKDVTDLADGGKTSTPIASGLKAEQGFIVIVGVKNGPADYIYLNHRAFEGHTKSLTIVVSNQGTMTTASF